MRKPRVQTELKVKALSALSVAAIELQQKAARRARREKGLAYARRVERRNDARKRQTGRSSEVAQ